MYFRDSVWEMEYERACQIANPRWYAHNVVMIDILAATSGQMYLDIMQGVGQYLTSES